MSITVDLPPDVVRRLETAAAARGLTLEEVAVEVLAEHAPDASPRRRRLPFGDVGASAAGITDRIDDVLADGFGRD